MDFEEQATQLFETVARSIVAVDEVHAAQYKMLHDEIAELRDELHALATHDHALSHRVTHHHCRTCGTARNFTDDRCDACGTR